MRRSYRDAMPARMALSDRDLRAMRRIAQPDDVATGPDEPIPWSVLEGLADLIPCDGISFFQLNADSKSVSATQDRPAEDFGGPLVNPPMAYAVAGSALISPPASHSGDRGVHCAV